ncbi:MAG: SagB/ThcOx family dehydrogenase [Firmicutes bacterium]|nr:SagB/ThcOx family dehydrogenase [Bacillota bacterium]
MTDRGARYGFRGIGHEFVEGTKYRNLGPSDQARGLPEPPAQKELPPQRRLAELPDPRSARVGPLDFTRAVAGRASVRRYSREPLALEELSYLLWCTQGVREARGRAALRTVPSAGARHALDTYLVVNRVAGLEPGLYLYRPVEHRLAVFDPDPAVVDRVMAACFGQYVTQAAVTFVWVAHVYRMTWKYGERGYRYLFLDAGHVCQNLYLAVQAVGAGCCAIGAFDDDELAAAIGVDGSEEIPLYAATVGKLREEVGAPEEAVTRPREPRQE